jgi:hypothetical protein
MEQFNVALALDRVLPAAQYGNSLTANTREAYDALRWQDERDKPEWEAIEAAGEALLVEQSQPTPADIAANIKAMVAELDEGLVFKYSGQIAAIGVYLAENNLNGAMKLLMMLLAAIEAAGDTETQQAAQPIVDYLTALGVLQ